MFCILPGWFDCQYHFGLSQKESSQSYKEQYTKEYKCIKISDMILESDRNSVTSFRQLFIASYYLHMAGQDGTAFFFLHT